MLVPVSHMAAIAATSCTRVVPFLHRPPSLTSHDPISPLSLSSAHRLAPLPMPPPSKPTPTHMDPDQVAAAGVQDDELGDATTSADGGGSGGESWGRALLRRGWNLSRKAAIAGVAATAAPVVTPPLLVLSFAGVALSVPFAAYLASLVATDLLMGALLPPRRTQPYDFCDLEDDEFLDASEEPGGETPVLDYWSEAEDDAIVEEDESYASLPLSRHPGLSEDSVPALNDEEGTTSEGEFHFQESGHESFVLDNRTQKEEDRDYITMEALPPRGFDDSRSAVPEFCEEDNMIPRIVEAAVASEEPVQELFVPDNRDKTDDGKRNATQETESSKEMVSQGMDIDSTEISDFPVPMLGKDDIVVQGQGECEVLVRKPGQEPLVSDVGDKTEEVLRLVSAKTQEMPPMKVDVSEPSVPDDNTLQREVEGDVTVEIVLEEVTINTDRVTEEVVGVQMDAISTELPECEPLHPSDLVAQEPQAMAEAAYVDDILKSTLTDDIVLDISETNTEGLEHIGERDVSSVVSVVTVGDVAEESKSMDDNVPARSMEPQDIDVSQSPVTDDQGKREDEVTVEMVLEEVTSTTDLVTGEVVGVQVDIIASGSDSPPLIDLMAQELQAVTEAAIVADLQESTVLGDIMKHDDKITEGVEHHSEGGACSFNSGASAVTMDDAEDEMSSRSTPYVSAICEDATSVEGRPDVEHPHETTGFEYKLTNEELKRKVLAEDKDNYTEEQLREQLDILRIITGYRRMTSLTLEAELAGLYIFVGVEPPVSSRDASDLTEINKKLRFLKSIIGVE